MRADGPLHTLSLPIALLGLCCVYTAPARAAGTTASECTAASASATKLAAAHKLRQAHDQAVACSAAGCSAKVKAACKKRATDLATAIPTVIFAVKDASGKDVTDVKVSMDGEALADHIDGSALSVDPGQHTFTFAAAGVPPIDQSFLLV
jgi:hypothetical protein